MMFLDAKVLGTIGVMKKEGENSLMVLSLLYIQAFCRSTVALVFAFSVLSKVPHMETFQEAIANFALLPAWFNRPAAWLFLLGEAAVMFLLLIGGPFSLAGYLLATGLLLLFCLAIGSVLVRRISTSCSCFGPTTRPVNAIDLVRNAGFIICAVAGYFTLAPSGSGQEILSIAEWSIIGLGALAVVSIWTHLGEIVGLFS